MTAAVCLARNERGAVILNAYNVKLWSRQLTAQRFGGRISGGLRALTFTCRLFGRGLSGGRVRRGGRILRGRFCSVCLSIGRGLWFSIARRGRGHRCVLGGRNLAHRIHSGANLWIKPPQTNQTYHPSHKCRSITRFCGLFFLINRTHLPAFPQSLSYAISHN